jgi:hypothetical protein
MTQASDIQGATICTEKAGLAAGTTTTYTTAAATGGSIRGKFATALAAQTNTATPTTQGDGSAFTALAAGEASVYVFTLVAAGTIAVFQGSVESLDDADAVNIAPSFPFIDTDTYMPFGYVVIVNDSTGSAWTFGASNWTATGVTDTYTDVTSLPLRAQSA